MKRVILTIIVILVIVCVASFFFLNNRSRYDINQEKNADTNLADNTGEVDSSSGETIIEEEPNEETKIEVSKYKDINSIPKIEAHFNDELIYAEPIKDGNELYVKLSDDFFIKEDKDVHKGEFGSDKRIDQIEILPSKIYSSEDNVSYLYVYNNEVYYIPVEKCNVGDEKIVYRDYGLEVIKKDDSIKIKNATQEKLLRYESSLFDNYTNAWKINDSTNQNEEEEYDFICDNRIYQVDLDDDNSSLEFIYSCGSADHIHIDTVCDLYSLVTYNDNQGVKIYNERILWFNNILNYKNVFYGYEAFEEGPKIDNLILVKESVITGYYLFDKQQGFIHVDRFANGEKYDETGFEKLSKVALTLDGQHTVKTDENGKYYIDAFPMYDMDYIYDENGNYKVNPNPKLIEDGTKIYINFISKDGLAFKFKTEDGTEYSINYYYV